MFNTGTGLAYDSASVHVTHSAHLINVLFIVSSNDHNQDFTGVAHPPWIAAYTNCIVGRTFYPFGVSR